jgi:6-phosphogluconolactonase
LPKVARDVDIVIEEHPAAFVAKRLADAARKGGHIVLTGGSTPRLAYELAAGLEADWTRAELWWSDERCVPESDERSNYGMARSALLDHVRTGAVHPMRGELGRTEGARLYEQTLGALERFDLMLLGLGPDGHVASLFPNEPTLDETERKAVGAEAKLEPFVDRVTLTLQMLCSAGDVLFLVTGENKADAAFAAFAGEPSRAIPGSLVRAVNGRTTAVLDAAAAARL